MNARKAKEAPMKAVTMYRTADGKLHDTAVSAQRHADERYGALLTALAAEAAGLWKYRQAVDWIEASLPRFQELLFLREDINLDQAGEGGE
jgi:hypothetical protein